MIWVSFSSHAQYFGFPAFAKSAISGPSLARSKAKYKRRSGEENKNPNNLKVTYSYVSDLPFKNFCKLAKQAEVLVTIKHCLGNSQINSIPAWSKEFSYITFLYRTLAKVNALARTDITSIHSQLEIKEIFDL